MTSGVKTTHVGSLPRPAALIELLRERHAGRTIDAATFDAEVRQAVSDVVAPAQTNSVPVIGVGAGLTVIVTVLAQPAGIV